ncbi:molybdenum ABC transporter substrate-binding protein [Clostridium carboxidivorans P7]|uniref:Molybdenum ABC transporter, periplasmic molybdate-binding protein n=1 Tax=Clostridium carboxidivorans P7 TaxID=536227 RepID=C6PXV4_9CLOT|nr:molybdate ABC transporter substrate-binding protein [Clostridium carboxidivorans]AKN31857.1 molybdenum ABC transporter substrate-binding protein [Clostridium carboxidivorans P7]EET85942.1 molybdenum ABC transporter, periplasmic molybdate-binding protein [Clostridium carboxidivorans P7]EFG87296.1 molybdate ABC transporter, periplasmic molybdate-binding protein [Clostridium carboxidivorans P7]
MKKNLLVLSILAATLIFSGCSQKNSETSKQSPKNITISAAASLKESLTEIQPKFEKDNNVKLTFNFGASGTLQKQIEQGAPADVFISAGKQQMDNLEKENLIDKSSRKNLLNNKLVLIVAKDYKDKIKSTSDLVNINSKLAMGEPTVVPAGQYGKESLEKLNIMDKVQSKIVYAKDVKQVVQYVENGEAAAGIVYKSDATVLKNSTIAETISESSHKPIVYPEAIVTASKEKETAKKFLDYLTTDSSKEIFKKYGFEVSVK